MPFLYLWAFGAGFMWAFVAGAAKVNREEPENHTGRVVTLRPGRHF